MHQTEIFRWLSICSKLQQVVRSGRIDVLALKLKLKFVIEALIFWVCLLRILC
jgi:hypothetical protein